MDMEEALTELLGMRRTDDLRSDLLRAARESIRRRRVNSVAGGVVLEALHDQVGMSYREISAMLDVPLATIHGWANPSPTTD